MADTILRSFYVYGLFRPDTGAIFYIGKGRGQRAWHHVQYRKRGRSHKDNIICKMIDVLGYKDIPVVLLRENLTNKESADLEIALIYAIGRQPYGPLINKTGGGDGGMFDPTDELRAILSKAQTGKKNTPETIARKSAAMKGRLPSGQTKAAEYLRGKPKSEETKRKISEKLRGRKQDPELVARRAAANSIAQKGRKLGPQSPELVEKRRQGLLRAYADGTRVKKSYMEGRSHSEESKQKIRESNIGQKRSIETREKMKASWEKRRG